MISKFKKYYSYIIISSIIIFLPIIAIDSNIIKGIGKILFNNVNFWIGYMAYIGSATLATATLIQNKRLHESNDKYQKMNEELLTLDKSQYTPRFVIGNTNQISIVDGEENIGDFKFNKLCIYSNYCKNHTKDRENYYYKINLNDSVNKGIELNLYYLGKGVCEKVQIQNIKFSFKEQKIIDEQILENNIKMMFFDRTSISLDIYWANVKEDLEIIELKIKMFITGKEEAYNEKIIIKFEKYNEINYISSVEYEKY